MVMDKEWPLQPAAFLCGNNRRVAELGAEVTRLLDSRDDAVVGELVAAVADDKPTVGLIQENNRLTEEVAKLSEDLTELNEIRKAWHRAFNEAEKRAGLGSFACVPDSAFPLHERIDELTVENARLREAVEAITFQPDPHTESKSDKWLILATRILRHLGRDDVADGLEAEAEVEKAKREREE